MEYEKIKEMIEEIKTMQVSEGQIYAYREEKDYYSDYNYTLVLKAEIVIEDLFTQLDNFEDDIKKAEEILKEWAFTSDESEIKEYLWEDYKHDYCTINNIDDFVFEMKQDRKQYDSEEIQKIWESLKKDGMYYIEDTTRTVITEEEFEIDWALDSCEDEYYRKTESDLRYSEEMQEMDEYWANNTHILRNDEYRCAKCSNSIKCSGTAEFQAKYPQVDFLCADCFDEEIIIESIKTELFANEMF